MVVNQNGSEPASWWLTMVDQLVNRGWWLIVADYVNNKNNGSPAETLACRNPRFFGGPGLSPWVCHRCWSSLNAMLLWPHIELPHCCIGWLISPVQCVISILPGASMNDRTSAWTTNICDCKSGRMGFPGCCCCTDWGTPSHQHAAKSTLEHGRSENLIAKNGEHV